MSIKRKTEITETRSGKKFMYSVLKTFLILSKKCVTDGTLLTGH